MNITDQIMMDGTITVQLIELAGSEAWRHEKRGPHGEWVSGSGGSTPRTPTAFRSRTHSPSPSPRRTPTGPRLHSTPAGMARPLQQAAAQNRAAAHEAVAARISEEKARQALDEAKAEVEKVTAQLKTEAKSEETAKHRVKLALHALLIMAAAALTALMAHFGMNEIAAAFAGATPYLAIELTDWKKKL